MKGSGEPAAHATRWITPVRIRGRGVKRDGLRRMFGSFAGKRGDMMFGVPREEEKDGGGGRRKRKERSLTSLPASSQDLWRRVVQDTDESRRRMQAK